MAVCRLAILDYKFNDNLGGYDANDLKDCVAFAQWQLRLGFKVGFDGQDWRGFINWAKRKLKRIGRVNKDKKIPAHPRVKNVSPKIN